MVAACVVLTWVGEPWLSVLYKHRREEMKQRSIKSAVGGELYTAWAVISDGVRSRPVSMLYLCSRQFYFVPADVATEAGCSRLASEVDRLMGCVDGLVSAHQPQNSAASFATPLLRVTSLPPSLSFRVAHGSTLLPNAVLPGSA